MVPVVDWLSQIGLVVELTPSELEQFRADNAAKLASLDERVKDAVASLGETEIKDAMLAKADFLKFVGDKNGALSQYRLTEEKTVGVGPKLDLVFSALEIAFFTDDISLAKAQIEKAKKLLDEGGDWERRNRLKVYEAMALIRTRQFERAAHLLQESVATFTCTELMSYHQFVLYTVIVSVVACDRPTLKSKVVDSPEILQVIHELPAADALINSLYLCQYRRLFEALVELSETISNDRFLSAHFHYYLREVRLKVYAQFLEAYRSVSLQSMAKTFGVSVDFLDAELSRFICSGRLSCKIDKIGGLVELQRFDSRNSTYQQIIKQGDALLNRVQKLSRVISV